MTARHLTKVLPSELEAVAHLNGADIEIDTANERAYVTIDNVTLYAELAMEPPC